MRHYSMYGSWAYVWWFMSPFSKNAASGAYMIDLTDQYCKDGTCPAVAGNVLVYLDDNHITWDYARTMAPALGERIAASTGWKVK